MKQIFLQNEGLYVYIDDADYKELSQYTWYAHRSNRHFYAVRGNIYGIPRTMLMHRQIMEKELNEPTLVIDHINHNTLDNRRSNLRVVTRTENNANTRRFNEQGEVKAKRGFRLKKGKFEAAIKYEGKYIYIGRFETEREAALAYNIKALEFWGECATLNDLSNEDLFPIEKIAAEDAKDEAIK